MPQEFSLCTDPLVYAVAVSAAVCQTMSIEYPSLTYAPIRWVVKLCLTQFTIGIQETRCTTCVALGSVSALLATPDPFMILIFHPARKTS